MARITPDMPQRGAARNLLQVVDNYYRPARDRVGEAAMSQGFQAASNFLGNEAGKAKKQQLEEIATKAKQDALHFHPQRLCYLNPTDQIDASVEVKKYLRP